MECYGVFKDCVVKCICTGGKIKVARETLILAFPDFLNAILCNILIALEWCLHCILFICIQYKLK